MIKLEKPLYDIYKTLSLKHCKDDEVKTEVNFIFAIHSGDIWRDPINLLELEFRCENLPLKKGINEIEKMLLNRIINFTDDIELILLRSLFIKRNAENKSLWPYLHKHDLNDIRILVYEKHGGANDT